MRTLVPFVEHGRDVVFPVLTPGAVMSVVTPAVAHSAEEHHFYEAEEKE